MSKVRFSYVSLPFAVDDDVNASAYTIDVEPEVAEEWKQTCTRLLKVSDRLTQHANTIKPTGETKNIMFSPPPTAKILRQLQ